MSRQFSYLGSRDRLNRSPAMRPRLCFIANINRPCRIPRKSSVRVSSSPMLRLLRYRHCGFRIVRRRSSQFRFGTARQELDSARDGSRRFQSAPTTAEHAKCTLWKRRRMPAQDISHCIRSLLKEQPVNWTSMRWLPNLRVRRPPCNRYAQHDEASLPCLIQDRSLPHGPS